MRTSLWGGLAFGYLPDPTKSILVVSEYNIPQAMFFSGKGLNLVTGSCYLRGYIRGAGAQTTWLEENVIGWEEAVNLLAGVVGRHPQAAYYGM